MRVVDSAPWVLPLGSVGQVDAGMVGHKAATLGRLVADGFAVPDGLVVTAVAASASLQVLGEQPDPERIRRMRLPDPLEEALAGICSHFGGVTLAVRSSAPAEDAPDTSYAGQFDTVLDVRGPEALRDAVRRCWASAGSDRVRRYRTSGPATGPIAVLVQEQVDADVAGVAFTDDPVTGDTGVVLVSAVPGRGDALVSGREDPDDWVVRGDVATPLRISHRALAAAQATAVADLALRIEQALGAPQDIEWAMADGRLVVLQARPVTALPQAPVVALPPGGTWLKETDRHPELLTALGASVAAPRVARGLTSMSSTAGGLIERFEARVVGGEFYTRVTPVGGHPGPPPPWWVLAVLTRVVPALRARMRAARQLLRAGVLEGRLDEWDVVLRPQLVARLERLASVDLPALDDEALTGHLDDVVATLHHALDVHFAITAPYLIPMHDLITTCADLLGWPASEALALVAGTSTATSSPTRDLADLGARIRENPAARAAVEHEAADSAGALRRVDPELAADFERWRDRYADRCVHDDPGSPTLRELPWLLTGLLQAAIDESAGSPDGSVRTRAACAERARRLLSTRRARHRDRFEAALSLALRAYPVREDSAFWTGSVPGGLVRTTAMEIGRRFVERGLVDRADDVVQVDVDTLRAAIDPGVGTPVLRPLVARARAERAWTRAHPGPAFHGPAPTGFPDLRGLPRAGRRVNRALVWMHQPEEVASVTGAAADAVLTGVAAAPGRCTGRVRVVTRASDFDRLSPGDVLVCRTADPAWSVLFGIAGALVTDGGGSLSHAAIVAREHSIPAVVGTGGATTTLRDDQIVSVDGGTGEVVLLEEAATSTDSTDRDTPGPRQGAQ